jgi:hypothetical protein
MNHALIGCLAGILECRAIGKGRGAYTVSPWGILAVDDIHPCCLSFSFFHHTILLSWSNQQKVIYILEECVAMLVSQESL